MEDSRMTGNIQTPTDTPAAEATEAEEFVHLNPADIIIGTNVRTDLRPDQVGAGEHRRPVLTHAQDDVIAIEGTPAELRALARASPPSRPPRPDGSTSPPRPGDRGDHPTCGPSAVLCPLRAAAASDQLPLRRRRPRSSAVGADRVRALRLSGPAVLVHQRRPPPDRHRLRPARTGRCRSPGGAVVTEQ
jgi:hypothetical protein